MCDQLTSMHDYLATTWRCKLMSLDKYIISQVANLFGKLLPQEAFYVLTVDGHIGFCDVIRPQTERALSATWLS